MFTGNEPIAVMETSRWIQVLVICLPVFAVIGTGKLLSHIGWFTDEHKNFANRLVFYFSLPALILREVAQQRFAAFWNPELILLPLLAIVIIALIYMIAGRMIGYRGSFAAATVFGTFWANVTYMGFPLSQNAFGEEGLAMAAIYNAFVMPTFVAMGFLLIGFYARREHDLPFGKRLGMILLNPIVLAAFAGILIALGAETFRSASGELQMHATALATIQIAGSWLNLIGSMGLPLALLSIGASLHVTDLRTFIKPLIFVLTGKLIILPFLTLFLFRLLAPDANPTIQGVAVMMASTPNAVASYVIAKQIGVQEGFVASLLVLGTLGSIVTIPFWLYWLI